MAATSAPQTVIAQNLQNTGSSTLSFPGNITSAPFYTRLTFYKYKRMRPNSKAEQQVTATIVLPMPQGLGDSQSPDWGQKELYQYGGVADTAQDWYNSYQRGNSIFDIAKKAITDASNVDLTNARNAGVLAMSMTTRQMRDGPVQSIIGQQLGAVVNPHLSLTFNGMALREHQLHFKCAPSSEAEATALGNIISKIRTESLPSYNPAVGKYALDYPSVCEVEFYGVDQNFKTKILRSAVKNFTTSLGNSGLAFYPKGVPVEVELVLSLQETEIVTKEDYNNVSGQQK